MNDGRLSREYFDLIKDALQEEEKTGGSGSSSPRKRRKLRSLQKEPELESESNRVVITIESDDEEQNNYDDDDDDDDDDVLYSSHHQRHTNEMLSTTDTNIRQHTQNGYALPNAEELDELSKITTVASTTNNGNDIASDEEMAMMRDMDTF